MKPSLHLFLLICITSFGQSDVPLTLYKQFNGKYNYVIIGNTHNSFDNFLSPSPPCQMLNQSSASLNLLPTQFVVGAYLQWAGIGDGTLQANPQINNTNINADAFAVANVSPSQPGLLYFSCITNITNLVQQNGNGTYSFSNLNLNPIINDYCGNGIFFSGWNIIIVFEDLNLQPKQLNVYSGLKFIGLSNINSIILPIENLNVISNQDASISYIAWNGSTNAFSNESILFNNNLLNNSLNPANNPFNSTNSFTGSTTNWSQDIDTFNISSYILPGDTQSNLSINSDFLRFLQAVVTSIRSELPDATVQLNTVLGQQTCNNRNLLVNYTVKNTNSNGNLPANMPVSFYADNVLLSTVNTTSPIAIGGVLPLQTTVAIPLSVSNTFNLRVVVDNTAANASTVAESNEGNNESLQSITLLSGNIMPTFAIQNSFCQGAIAPVLLSLSSNNIAGSWLPSVVDNQQSGSYVFKPNAGVCASNFTLTVNVTPSVTPTFSMQNTFCAGATVPVLPIVSNNNISGTWSPLMINNQTSGNYVFTPTAGTCAAQFTLNVVVTNPVTPAFGVQNSFCAGAIVPILPAMSSNNIAGAWLPSVIDNQNIGSYLFTPSSSACALPFRLNVTITPNITPIFALQNTFCQGATVPLLPTIAANGISGSWLPSVINNQASGSYVFEPNAGICASNFVLNIIVVPQTTTIQNLFICENTNQILVLDSGLNPNDFTFVWTLDNVVINQNTSSLSVAAAGNYQLVATANALGCQQTINFNVIPFQTFTANFVVKDDFDADQSIAVEAIGGSGQFEYSFNNQSFQNYNIYSVSDGGDIVVKVRDSNNCYEISKTITIWQYPRFFTPNNDSFNDSWSIKSSKKIDVSVFDRFGRLLKQLKSGDSWNGTFNAQPLPADDYWFVLSSNEQKVFKGHFSLER